jgi:hypothetical protein
MEILLYHYPILDPHPKTRAPEQVSYGEILTLPSNKKNRTLGAVQKSNAYMDMIRKAFKYRIYPTKQQA